MKARTDKEGVLRIVTTAEYEEQKRPGIAAPYPGQEAALLYQWAASERVYYRRTDEDEWTELDHLTDGETFPLHPGSSIRLESPPGIMLEMW